MFAMFRIDMCVGKLCGSNHEITGKLMINIDQLSTWGIPWFFPKNPLPVGRIPVFFLYLDSSLHQDIYGVWEVVDRDCSEVKVRWIRKSQSFFGMEKSGFI